MSIIGNIKKRGLKDISNPDKWKAYAEGSKIIKDGVHLSYEEILPFCEIVMYRSILCKDCAYGEKCEHCDCKMPAGIFTLPNFCSGDKWPKFTIENWVQEWYEFKEKNNIDFHVF